MNYEYEINRMIDTCLLNVSTGVRKLSVTSKITAMVSCLISTPVIVNPGNINKSSEISKCSLII